jgi:hypothetical protein
MKTKDFKDILGEEIGMSLTENMVRIQCKVSDIESAALKYAHQFEAQRDELVELLQELHTWHGIDGDPNWDKAEELIQKYKKV